MSQAVLIHIIYILKLNTIIISHQVDQLVSRMLQTIPIIGVFIRNLSMTIIIIMAMAQDVHKAKMMLQTILIIGIFIQSLSMTITIIMAMAQDVHKAKVMLQTILIIMAYILNHNMMLIIMMD